MMLLVEVAAGGGYKGGTDSGDCDIIGGADEEAIVKYCGGVIANVILMIGVVSIVFPCRDASDVGDSVGGRYIIVIANVS